MGHVFQVIVVVANHNQFFNLESQHFNFFIIQILILWEHDDPFWHQLLLDFVTDPFETAFFELNSYHITSFKDGQIHRPQQYHLGLDQPQTFSLSLVYRFHNCYLGALIIIFSYLMEL